jgi:hypothetical protein
MTQQTNLVTMQPDSTFAGIVLAEYNYIAQTAFQANEDRARFSQFFLTTFGAFIAALFSIGRTGGGESLYGLFAALFLFLVFFGILTTYQLVILRRAWLGSVKALNHLKTKAAELHPELLEIYPWSNTDLPKAFKISSIGGLMAVSISAISGLMLAASYVFMRLAMGAEAVPWFAADLIGAMGFFGVLLICYIIPLKRTKI